MCGPLLFQAAACFNAAMQQIVAHAMCNSSAYQASGMTSRARRRSD